MGSLDLFDVGVDPNSSYVQATQSFGQYTNIMSSVAQSSNLSSSGGQVTASSTTAQPDLRVRLAAQVDSVYDGALLQPLVETSGLMFPYTPSVSVSQDVDYANMQMVHSNTDYNSYSRTPNTTISVHGKFTVQNQREGRYAMAAIHFLRTVSKMYFGENDSHAGLPPPILVFSGYGTYNFNKVRVILRSHNYSYDETMNMVPVNVAGSIVYLPAMFTLAVSLTTQPTAKMMRQDFTLDGFRSGALLQSGGWI